MIPASRLRAAIEALPVHTVDGYEWDCSCMGEYDMLTGRRLLPDGRECPHSDPDGIAISRADVMAVIDRLVAP